jgi:hypothetical protein
MQKVGGDAGFGSISWLLFRTPLEDVGGPPDQLEGCFFFLSFAHLARAAFRALALRSSAVSLAALVFPPFAPPIFPNATA